MDTIDTLDFAELEYDVGGAGAVESNETQVNQAAYIFRFK